MAVRAFKLLKGKHREGGTRTHRLYKPGEIVKSDLPLDKMFRNKFHKLSKDEVEILDLAAELKAKKKTKGKKKVTIKKTGKKKVTTKTIGDDGLGTEATKNWDDAKENGLKVYRRGTYYHVYEKGSKTPLNASGLKKAKVQEFLTGYLEE